MTFPLDFPPTLSLVWVAASIGPSLRSPYGRLSPKNLDSVDLPQTCSLIAHADLPLRIASTLLKGAAIIFYHQCSLHYSLTTNTVQHLRLLLSSSSSAAFSLPLHGLIRKDTLTMPEYPGLIELMLASHISELHPFLPAPLDPQRFTAELEPERRRAIKTPSPASFLSTVDTSLLSQSTPLLPSTITGQTRRALSQNFDPEANRMDVDLDLGLDLPPLEPFLPESFSPLFPSTITPDPLQNDRHSLPDLEAGPHRMPEHGGHPDFEPLEPVRKRSRLVRGYRIDSHLEISSREWTEPSVTRVAPMRRGLKLSQITDRVLGPLMPRLASDFAESCTFNNVILFSAPPDTFTVDRNAHIDVETRRAMSATDHDAPFSNLFLESPDQGSISYQLGLPAVARPSISPMSSFGSFGARQSFSISEFSPLPPPTTFPLPSATGLELPVTEEEYEGMPFLDQASNAIMSESAQFLEHLKLMMNARDSNQLSFNEIIEDVPKTKRVAAQAFYHIVALASLGRIKIRQEKPFDMMYLHHEPAISV